ncbi:MAG: sodium-dependent bicarbonate transport family permease [Candidatus Tectimicrobiota bacterium]|nr:MAG: sodium-dependent bicarbonate transport family permease [Candidatus Tectomicrobia bacterium]
MSVLDPVILFFLLGVAAGLARSDIRIPAAIYDFLSLYLLLAIGLKGGVELAKYPLVPLLPKMVAVFLLGLVLPVIAYPILRRAGKFKRADAASIAAHYGSVSAGTYAVALAYLGTQNVMYESYTTLFLALLEMPAIIVGVLLARGITGQTQWGRLLHEVFAGKAMVCLLGGLAIGWVAGEDGLTSIHGFFFDLFRGMLALFLLEMGLLAAAQMSALRRYGLFLVAFGVFMPLFAAVLGCGVGRLLGLSLGGTALLTVLAASASYIAVPAAMRISVPEANPTLSLAASLGVTFPFNVTLGIPLYLQMARWIHELL